jgi:hypothetical protein
MLDTMRFEYCVRVDEGHQGGNVLPVAFSSAGWTGILLVGRLVVLLQLSASFDNLTATDVFLDVFFESGCWFEVGGFTDVLQDARVVVVIGFYPGREGFVGEEEDMVRYLGRARTRSGA